jgi:hypothetical protein
MGPAIRVACLAPLVLLPACGGSRILPLGPTAADEGIVIYIHSGFRGTSQAVAADVRNLGLVEGPCAKGGDSETAPTLTWDDCVSSIKVMPGWGATIYPDRDFKGTPLEVTADALDLSALTGTCKGSYNDCVSSVKVYRR